MWRINISEAPKDHPDLGDEIQNIQNKLADPGFIKSLCVHESAHAIYWGFLERETIPDYTIRIRRNSLGFGCIVEYAAVLLVNATEQKAWTILGLAKAHAAGGAAVEILAPGYERGDSEDFENFRKDILAVTRVDLSDLKAVWQAACEEIKMELQAPNSAIRSDIESRAIEFERNFRLASETG